MPTSLIRDSRCVKNGTPAVGSMGLGADRVSGRRRVPLPPTSTTASTPCTFFLLRVTASRSTEYSDTKQIVIRDLVPARSKIRHGPPRPGRRHARPRPRTWAEHRDAGQHDVPDGLLGHATDPSHAGQRHGPAPRPGLDDDPAPGPDGPPPTARPAPTAAAAAPPPGPAHADAADAGVRSARRRRGSHTGGPAGRDPDGLEPPANPHVADAATQRQHVRAAAPTHADARVPSS